MIAFSFPINSISKTGRVWENSSGGGSLLDLGVYPIYYSYKLFGFPNDIKAKSKIVKDIDSYTEIVFSYDGFNAYIKSGIDIKGAMHGLSFFVDPKTYLDKVHEFTQKYSE